MYQKPHKHKAMKKKVEVRGWDCCVAPDVCEGNFSRKDAHGNVIYTDTCACGAKRESESNGRSRNFGPWRVAGESETEK